MWSEVGRDSFVEAGQGEGAVSSLDLLGGEVTELGKAAGSGGFQGSVNNMAKAES